MSDPRKALRILLGGVQCVYCPSVFDPLSARMAQELGFRTGILGGSIVSLATLGSPDLNLLALGELVEQARRICGGSDLPLIVDADHGYGNALNVVRAVRELEAAGVAALSLEDTLIPRPYGADGFLQISTAEMCGRLRAAIGSRRDPGLVLMARTHAGPKERDAETSSRLLAYENAGVDALCVTGVADVAQFERVTRGLRRPVVLISYAGQSLESPAVLQQLGVRLIVDGHHAYLAAIQAVHDTLKSLRLGVPAASLPGLATPQFLAHISRRSDWERHERAFLGLPEIENLP